MRSFSIRLIVAAVVLAPLTAGAQAGPGAALSLNPLPIAMVGMVALLVMANYLLGKVMKQLAEALRDKNRKERSAAATVVKTTAILVALLIPALPVWAQEATTAAATAAAAPEPSFLLNPSSIGGMDRLTFLFLLTIILVLFFVLIVQARIVNRLVRQVRGIPEKDLVPLPEFSKKILNIFTKAVPVEEEASIMLDHDYDGIRELDNDLPPWWKWGFVLTIVVSVLYMGYYHAWGGPSQEEEYLQDVARAEEEKAAYLAKSGEQIDENTVTQVLDEKQLADAKVVFTNTCAACHGAEGGGGVGPNLTDDYWLHGGSVKDVFKSIKYGYGDKGMPPWNGNLSAKQIAGIASYIKTLKGTKPAGGKAPQGELFVEGGDGAMDSVTNQTEISLTPTGTTENKNNTIGPYPNKADGKGEGTPPGKLKK